MSTYETLKYNFTGASLTGIEGTATGTIATTDDATALAIALG